MFKKTTLAVALSLFAIPAFAQTTVGTVQVASGISLKTITVSDCERAGLI